MRSRNAFANLMTNIILQLVQAAAGFILPRLLIVEYGSDINGLVSSVSQFISWMGLVEAGISAAAAVSLYGPIARNEQHRINAILSGVKRFYRKSGIIYLVLLVALTLAYPAIVETDIDRSLIQYLILILGANGVIEYFMLGRYKVYLIAAQKNYIISLTQVIGLVISTVASILLVRAHADILLVKGVAAATYLLRAMFTVAYVKRREPGINFKAPPDNTGIVRHQDVLVHQISGMVTANTDLVIISTMLGASALTEASVYSVYNMVAYALYSFVNAFSGALCAGMGDVIARREQDKLKEVHSQFEGMYLIMAFLIYLCMANLILPFVGVYTNGITDAAYYRPLTAILFTLAGLMQAVRIPSLTVVSAAGHYRETRSRAVIEMILNITVSILLVRRMGMEGVLVGTAVCYTFSSIAMIIYNAKQLVPGSGKMTAMRLLRNGALTVALYFGFSYIIPARMSGYGMWFLYAILEFAVAALVLAGVNYLFEPGLFKAALARLKEIKGAK